MQDVPLPTPSNRTCSHRTTSVVLTDFHDRFYCFGAFYYAVGSIRQTTYLKLEDVETPIQEVVGRDEVHHRLLRLRRYPRPHWHQLQQGLVSFVRQTDRKRLLPFRVVFFSLQHVQYDGADIS